MDATPKSKPVVQKKKKKKKEKKRKKEKKAVALSPLPFHTGKQARRDGMFETDVGLQVKVKHCFTRHFKRT